AGGEDRQPSIGAGERVGSGRGRRRAGGRRYVRFQGRLRGQRRQRGGGTGLGRIYHRDRPRTRCENECGGPSEGRDERDRDDQGDDTLDKAEPAPDEKKSVHDPTLAHKTSPNPQYLGPRSTRVEGAVARRREL